MADNYPQEWRSRREIPNPQIRDAADQYEKARAILGTHPPGSGVLLPLMNAASMATELYLKCLAGEVVHIPEETGPTTGISQIDEILSNRVYARASWGRHNFRQMLDNVDEDVRSRLEATYMNVMGRAFRSDLSSVEDALVVTRYPFEPNHNLEGIPLNTLMLISEFLKNFVASLEPRETIVWKDGSITRVEDV